jgi:hypothetical protein
MPEPLVDIRSLVEEQPPVTEQQQRIEGQPALVAEQRPAVAQVPTEEARWRTVVRPTAVRLPTGGTQERAAAPLLIEEAQAQTAVARRLVAEARVRAVEVQRQIEEARAPATAQQWLAAVGHRPVIRVAAVVTAHLEVGEATAGRAVV